MRMRAYWKRLKTFRRYLIASIISRDNDTRPYIPITIGGSLYFALLDSGANKSIIGGDLCHKIQGLPGFRKCHGSVRTADGQRQYISGVTEVEFKFQDCDCRFEFLVIESIKQDLICGIDFWDKFKISISMNGEIGEVDNTDPGEDFIELSMNQRKKLDTIVRMFPSSEREGLGCTDLVKHTIDTGNSTPIRQRYYPI